MITTRHALAAAALLAASGAAHAAPAPAPDRGATRIAQADANVRPASVETEDEAVNCSRSRRRLWIEGEGWIVRRVTTCR